MYSDERNLTVAEAPVVPRMMPWQQMLLGSAQYIREHGWCQHHDRDESGAVCLRGAILTMCEAYPLGTFSAAWSRIQRKIENGSPTEWNDKPHRCKEQVIELLESVAKGG